MEMEKTIGYAPTPSYSATLLVIDRRCKPTVVPLRGNMTFGRRHSGKLCDILVDSVIVGRNHGEFIYESSQNAYYYIDNNSLNGTYINGYKLEKYNERGSKAFRLNDGDILRIDRTTLNQPHPEAVIMIFCLSIR